MENGVGFDVGSKLSQQLSSLSVNNGYGGTNTINGMMVKNDGLFQVMKAVEAAEATIKQQACFDFSSCLWIRLIVSSPVRCFGMKRDIVSQMYLATALERELSLQARPLLPGIQRLEICSQLNVSAHGHGMVSISDVKNAVSPSNQGVKTRVRTTMGSTEFFQVEVGLHQGSAISPYLFTLILDELSRGIQESIPWCMIFADDIVLIAESAEGLNNRIEKWREALEDNGLRVSREKTEYLRCDFGWYEVLHQEVNIRIGDRILQPKSLLSIWGSGFIDSEESRRKMLLTVLEAELDVDSIIVKMREGRLRWFGHVKRRRETAPIRRVEAMLVEGSRRGRPKLRWEDRLKQDMKELLLSEDMTSDRNAWRDRIRISG
ncbi:retrovirus-related pol polyprotein LINE-1 [Tanacetum coccineum]